jgi:hypothetical protein
MSTLFQPSQIASIFHPYVLAFIEMQNSVTAAMVSTTMVQNPAIVHALDDTMCPCNASGLVLYTNAATREHQPDCSSPGASYRPSVYSLQWLQFMQHWIAEITSLTMTSEAKSILTNMIGPGILHQGILHLVTAASRSVCLSL